MNKTEPTIRLHLEDFELRTGCKVLYVAIVGSSEYDSGNPDSDVDVAFVYDHPEKGIMPLKKNISFKVDKHDYTGVSHISHVRNLAIGSTQNWNVAMAKRVEWENAGVPFNHGALIYLFTHMNPYSTQVRETENGWVDVGQWVIDFYNSNPELTEYINHANSM